MSRRRWKWHPAAVLESQELQNKDQDAHARLASKLVKLVTCSGRRPGESASGRIRQEPFVKDSALRFVLFVERADGRGLGGLLICRCQPGAKNPPSAVYQVASRRLREIPEW
jgi:hypothetical protein